MDKITIITVTYNAVSDIERTVKSVLSLEGNDIEYIIIDGGSTDGTVDVVKKYINQIAYFVSEADQGIYDAMNKGVKAATGEWVAFLNSGDTYYPHALDCLKDAKPDEDIIYGDTTGTDIHGNRKKLEVYTPEYILYHIISCHQGIFARRRVFEKIGYFDCSYKICADYEWLLRAYLDGSKFRYVEGLVADYLGGGVSATNFELLYKEGQSISERLLKCGLVEDRNIIDRIRGFRRKESQLYFIKKALLLDNDDCVANYLKQSTMVLSGNSFSIWGMGTWGLRMANYLKRHLIPVECYIDGLLESGSISDNYQIDGPSCLGNYKGIVLLTLINETACNEIKKQIQEMENDNLSVWTLWELGEAVFRKDIDEAMRPLE